MPNTDQASSQLPCLKETCRRVGRRGADTKSIVWPGGRCEETLSILTTLSTPPASLPGQIGLFTSPDSSGCRAYCDHGNPASSESGLGGRLQYRESMPVLAAAQGRVSTSNGGRSSYSRSHGSLLSYRQAPENAGTNVRGSTLSHSREFLVNNPTNYYVHD